MTTNTTQSTTEESRKTEEEQRIAAEKSREAFLNVIKQVEESQLIDENVALLVKGTREIVEEVKIKLEESREAEQEVQKAITDSIKAEELVTSVSRVEEDKAKAFEVAKEDLSKAEKDRDDKKNAAVAEPANQQLKEALDAAEKALTEKRTAEQTAQTEHKNAEAQTKDAKEKLETAREVESKALTKTKQAREEEATVLARWEKIKEGPKVLRTRLTSTWGSRFMDAVTSNLVSLFLIVVGGIGLVVLSGVISVEFLRLIQDVNVARGLITFMVAMVTVTLAIVLSIYPMISSEDKDNKLGIKERFLLAKEIIMLFVGILGTIVGFYFASDHNGGSVEQSIPSFYLSSSEVQAGDEVTLASLITAGTPPYKFEVSSDPKGIEKSGEKMDKFIYVPVKTPTSISEDTIYTITLTVTDNKNTKVSESAQKIMVKKGASVASPTVPITPDLSLKPNPVEIGKKFTLEGKLAPATLYEITSASEPALKFAPDGSGTVRDNKSETGDVKDEFVVPLGSLPGNYKLMIKTDNAGKTESYTLDLNVIPPPTQ